MIRVDHAIDIPNAATGPLRPMTDTAPLIAPVSLAGAFDEPGTGDAAAIEDEMARPRANRNLTDTFVFADESLATIETAMSALDDRLDGVSAERMSETMESEPMPSPEPDAPVFDPLVYSSGDADVLDDEGGLVHDFFNIDLLFFGDLYNYAGIDIRGAHVAAAEFLSDIIRDGLSDEIGFTTFGGPEGPNFFVDDVAIEVYSGPIDGAGEILGQASPYLVRTAEDAGTAATGLMEFDVADVPELVEMDLWDDVVLHEMMHVLGFGTLWDDLVMEVTLPGRRWFDPRDDVQKSYYTGLVGNLLSDELLPIEVERDGGEGTAFGHWDEARYGGELMTGFVDRQNYLSDASLGVLADLGYDVDILPLLFGDNPLADGIDLWSAGDPLVA